MAGKLDGKTIAFVVAQEGAEQVELTEPWKAVEAEGGTPELLSTESGEIQAFNHLDKGDTFTVDKTVADADVADYDGLVLPGGVANPDFLRTDEDAVSFIRGFFEAAKPVGVICHGPWTLVEADVLKGRTITSWPSLQTDIRNAGGTWVDEEVVVDEGLVSSRNPDDLPAFCAKIVEESARASTRRRRGASRPRLLTVAILDIDGTLVDTNYHHAIAWHRAFRAHGFVVQLWRIHRHIGMGGDQLVASLIGEEADAEHGDGIRDAEKEAYAALIDEVAPLEGARELIARDQGAGSHGGPRLVGQGRRGRALRRPARRPRPRRRLDHLGRRRADQAGAGPGRHRAREGRWRRCGHGRRLDLGLRGRRRMPTSSQ